MIQNLDSKIGKIPILLKIHNLNQCQKFDLKITTIKEKHVIFQKKHNFRVTPYL